MKWLRARLRKSFEALARGSLGAKPLEELGTWISPLGSHAGRSASEVHSKLQRSRRSGARDAPWMPPSWGRWLRTPGCRPYAALLLDALRRQGIPAKLVVGVAPDGGHAWVEAEGFAFDLESSGPQDPQGLRGRFSLVRAYDPDFSRGSTST